MKQSLSHFNSLIIFAAKHLATALKCFWPLMIITFSTNYFDSSGALAILLILQIILEAYGKPKWVQFHERNQKVNFFSLGKIEKLYLQKSVQLLLVYVAIILIPLLIFLLLILSFSSLSNYLETLLTSGISPLEIMPVNGKFLIIMLSATLYICILLYLFFRFGFIAAAASLGENISLKESWKISKGLFWKWFGGALYVQVIALMLPFVLSIILIKFTTAGIYQNIAYGLGTLTTASIYGLFIKDFL
ncbi:MAG: hypothetical protein H6925_03975 [Holosporaceae bacterium]|nr:MAG: hypothetical protein H6925_03975 [Holosporaceae bacterium]